MKFILGKKLGMSQFFDKEGKVVPVSLIEAGPCFVQQIKNIEKDGYEAIQIGFLRKSQKEKTSRKKKNSKKFIHLKEFRIVGDEKEYKVGDKINAAIFKEGDIVKISAVSKSKGFQGVVKRWGFHGASKTHGTKHMLRAPGSIGSTGPEKVFKGKKMAGRMGGERITVKNLTIVKVDEENNLLAVRGALPGNRRTLVEITKQ